MSYFSLISTVTTAVDAAMSRITDLAIGTNGTTLYSTTRYDGQLTAWTITGIQLSQLDRDTFATGALPVAMPGLTFIDKGGVSVLLSGGAAHNEMTLHEIENDGSFDQAQTLGAASTTAGTLVSPTSVDLADGNTAVYGGVQGGGRIATMIFDDDANLRQTTITPDAGNVVARDITALATTQVGGDHYLFSTSDTDLGGISWRILENGDLKSVQTLTTRDGLWINAPTALATANVGDKAFLVLAAAGSGSLSVMEIAANGKLQLTTHILDDLNTRFAGVSALTTVDHHGQAYVIAGGSDDCISVFSLLPNGALLLRGSLADTVDMTLANVGAIAAQSSGTGIDIFVSSSTEAGLTRLHFETGTAGVTQTAEVAEGVMSGTAGSDILIGGLGADRINAGAGDDMITDDAGIDILTGGAGDGIFVLTANGQTDVITDFEVGINRIDLSGWANLRSIAQLSMTETATGIEIGYGKGILTVHSINGRAIAPNALSETDLLEPARLPLIAVEGVAGPLTQAPDLPDRPDLPTPAPAPFSAPEIQEQFGTNTADTLRGGDTNDMLWGQGGADKLYGKGGADLLFGGEGVDALYGGDGNDMLYGGGGRDTDWQKPLGTAGFDNADMLYGGDGDDDILDMAGADWIDGGTGDDGITGGAGRDTFVFRSGHDTITDFTRGLDRIEIDDSLWDGTLTMSEIINHFATVNAGSTTFDFGNDHSLTPDRH